MEAKTGALMEPILYPRISIRDSDSLRFCILRPFPFMAVVQDRWLYKPLEEDKEEISSILPPCHTGEPHEEVLEVLAFSMMALKKSGPGPRSTLPTTDKALLHVPSV